MLDFEECEFSGHLRAGGNKGEYWIIQDESPGLHGVTGVCLERTNPGPHGVITQVLGVFDRLEDAGHCAEKAEYC